MGDMADGDLWEAMDLLLSRMKGEVEVQWVRGHQDKRGAVGRQDEEEGRRQYDG
jgi:ribonuclease HI